MTSTPRTIAIVRHGETDWNLARRIQGRTEVPLNATGRAQALATAQLLHSRRVREAHGDWSGLHASPLGRAVETAGILASTLHLAEPRIEPALYERDFGPAEGLSVDDAHSRWPGLAIPGAETREALAARTSEVFRRILEDTPGTIVVAHGAMIRAGLSRLTGHEVPRVLNGEVWMLSYDSVSHRTFRLERS